jgi:hypothetical protein
MFPDQDMPELQKRNFEILQGREKKESSREGKKEKMGI